MKFDNSVLKSFLFGDNVDLLEEHLRSITGTTCKVVIDNTNSDNLTSGISYLPKDTTIEQSINSGKLSKNFTNNLKRISEIEVDLDRNLITSSPRDFNLIFNINQEHYSSSSSGLKSLEEDLKNTIKIAIDGVDKLVKSVSELHNITKIKDKDKFKKAYVNAVNKTFNLSLSEEESEIEIIKSIMGVLTSKDYDRGITPVAGLIIVIVILAIYYLILALVILSIKSILKILAGVIVGIFRYFKSFITDGSPKNKDTEGLFNKTAELVENALKWIYNPDNVSTEDNYSLNDLKLSLYYKGENMIRETDG